MAKTGKDAPQEQPAETTAPPPEQDAPPEGSTLDEALAVAAEVPRAVMAEVFVAIHHILRGKQPHDTVLVKPGEEVTFRLDEAQHVSDLLAAGMIAPKDQADAALGHADEAREAVRTHPTVAL